jgi:predicted nucleic acid-binding protein
VIALCLSVEAAEAILDDRAARRCAAALGLRVCGTVGLLVRARRAGLVANLRTELDAVRKLGLRIDDALIQRALVLGGEAPP